MESNSLENKCWLNLKKLDHLKTELEGVHVAGKQMSCGEILELTDQLLSK